MLSEQQRKFCISNDYSTLLKRNASGSLIINNNSVITLLVCLTNPSYDSCTPIHTTVGIKYSDSIGCSEDVAVLLQHCENSVTVLHSPLFMATMAFVCKGALRENQPFRFVICEASANSTIAPVETEFFCFENTTGPLINEAVTMSAAVTLSPESPHSVPLPAQQSVDPPPPPPVPKSLLLAQAPMLPLPLPLPLLLSPQSSLPLPLPIPLPLSLPPPPQVAAQFPPPQSQLIAPSTAEVERLSRAFESFCDIRNWLDYSVLSLGGIDWLNLPTVSLAAASAFQFSLASSSASSSSSSSSSGKKPAAPLQASLTNNQKSALTRLRSIKSLYRSENVDELKNFFKGCTNEIEDAVRHVADLSKIVLRTIEQLQVLVCQPGPNAAYAVEIVTDKYLEEKAAFTYLEKFFLRTPYLDVPSIIGDCFMSDEVLLLVGRSRPTKRLATAASTGKKSTVEPQQPPKKKIFTAGIHN